VQIGGKGTYLFTVGADNTVEQRPVTQGVKYQDLVVVLQGVKPGETVVVEGQIALANGMKVNPQPYSSGTPEPAPQHRASTGAETQKNSTSGGKQDGTAAKPETAS
jgi:multidrug efflux system membrane fusion protein